MFGSVRAVRSAPLRFVVRQFFDLPFKLPVECAVGVEENGGGAEPENFGDEYDGDSGEREGESPEETKAECSRRDDQGDRNKRDNRGPSEGKVDKHEADTAHEPDDEPGEHAIRKIRGNNGRHYAVLRVSNPADGDWGLSLTTTMNLQDFGFVLLPELAYSGWHNLIMTLRFIRSFGPRWSEYVLYGHVWSCELSTELWF